VNFGVCPVLWNQPVASQKNKSSCILEKQEIEGSKLKPIFKANLSLLL
jgi:hypothetical protein